MQGCLLRPEHPVSSRQASVAKIGICSAQSVSVRTTDKERRRVGERVFPHHVTRGDRLVKVLLVLPKVATSCLLLRNLKLQRKREVKMKIIIFDLALQLEGWLTVLYHSLDREGSQQGLGSVSVLGEPIASKSDSWSYCATFNSILTLAVIVCLICVSGIHSSSLLLHGGCQRHALVRNNPEVDAQKKYPCKSNIGSMCDHTAAIEEKAKIVPVMESGYTPTGELHDKSVSPQVEVMERSTQTTDGTETAHSHCDDQVKETSRRADTEATPKYYHHHHPLTPPGYCRSTSLPAEASPWRQETHAKKVTESCQHDMVSLQEDIKSLRLVIPTERSFAKLQHQKEMDGIFPRKEGVEKFAYQIIHPPRSRIEALSFPLRGNGPPPDMFGPQEQRGAGGGQGERGGGGHGGGKASPDYGGIILQDRRSELVRLSTLARLPSTAPVSAIVLAQAGWSSTGRGDETECFQCGVRHSGWRAEDCPVQVHQELSPQCSFLQHPHGDNIPMHDFRDASLCHQGTCRPRLPPPGRPMAVLLASSSDAARVSSRQGGLSTTAPSHPLPNASSQPSPRPPSQPSPNAPSQPSPDTSSQLSNNTTSQLSPNSSSQLSSSTLPQLSTGAPSQPPVNPPNLASPPSLPSLAPPPSLLAHLPPPPLLRQAPDGGGSSSQPQSLPARRPGLHQGTAVPPPQRGDDAELFADGVEEPPARPDRGEATLPSSGDVRSNAAPGQHDPSTPTNGALGGSEANHSRSPCPPVQGGSGLAGGSHPSTPANGEAMGGREASSPRLPSPPGQGGLGGAGGSRGTPGLGPGPSHPGFSSLERRLASFATWPRDSFQSPTDLAQLGFFWAGSGDAVRCFWCGLGLKDWGEGDVPLHEHVRWRSSCDHLRSLVSQREIFAILAQFARRSADDESEEEEEYSEEQLRNMSPSDLGVRLPPEPKK